MRCHVKQDQWRFCVGMKRSEGEPAPATKVAQAVKPDGLASQSMPRGRVGQAIQHLVHAPCFSHSSLAK